MKDNLDLQSNRLRNFCSAKGWKITSEVKEVASGINDKRTKLQEILSNKKINIIVVEDKDRLIRFRFNYISTLLNSQNRRVEVINESENDKKDLITDLVSIIYYLFLLCSYVRKKKS